MLGKNEYPCKLDLHKVRCANISHRADNAFHEQQKGSTIRYVAWVAVNYSTLVSHKQVTQMSKKKTTQLNSEIFTE